MRHQFQFYHGASWWSHWEVCEEEILVVYLSFIYTVNFTMTTISKVTRLRLWAFQQNSSGKPSSWSNQSPLSQILSFVLMTTTSMLAGLGWKVSLIRLIPEAKPLKQLTDTHGVIALTSHGKPRTMMTFKASSRKPMTYFYVPTGYHSFEVYYSDSK